MISEVRKRVRETVFKRGITPYFSMLLVIIIFSFLNAFYSTDTKEVKSLENHMETTAVEKQDVDAVEKYIVSMSIFDGLPDIIKDKVISNLARYLAKAHPTVLNSLASNQEYFEESMGEVVFILILGMIIFGVIKFFLTRPFLVGEYRYLMEARFQQNVRIRRIFAPFGNRKFIRVYTTMSRYNLITLLWWFTIIGGFYKHYQYIFVRHIVAENPSVKWKQARDLSKAMTNGYKFTIFKLQLSYIYLVLLRYIPFGELCVATPIRANSSIEMYFYLRKRTDIDRSLFIEKAFDEKPYVDRIEEGEKPEDIKPEYVLQDFRAGDSNFDENDHYNLREYIVVFFLSSFIGWLWEFGNSLIMGKEYINSDSMFGPWIALYGVFGLIFVSILSRFKTDKTKFAIGDFILSFLLEFFNSFLFVFSNMNKFTNKSIFISIYQRFSISSFFAFAIIGFLLVYIVGPLVKYGLERMGEKKAKILCRSLIVLYVLDMILSAVYFYKG